MLARLVLPVQDATTTLLSSQHAAASRFAGEVCGRIDRGLIKSLETRLEGRFSVSQRVKPVRLLYVLS